VRQPELDHAEGLEEPGKETERQTPGARPDGPYGDSGGHTGVKTSGGTPALIAD
jgi:hypothetical protein